MSWRVVLGMLFGWFGGTGLSLALTGAVEGGPIIPGLALAAACSAGLFGLCLWIKHS